MIYIIVNDLSFVSQATTIPEGVKLLSDMRQALEALRKHLGEASVHRPRAIKDAPVTATQNLGAFIQANLTNKSEREQLLLLLTKGPYFDGSPLTMPGKKLPKHQCHYKNRPFHDTALAYAAHLSSPEPFCGTHRPAALLSLAGAADFADDDLHVDFIDEEAPKPNKARQGKRKKSLVAADTSRVVWNVTREKQVADVRRRYKANDKKHLADSDLDSYISPMDLDAQTAERVLAEGVLLPTETQRRRIFGRHNGKYYIFPCHDQRAHEYHGFCVKEKDIHDKMPDVYAQLRKMSFFERS